MHQPMALAGRIALGAGVIGLGALCFAYASLDPHWQHPPEHFNTPPLAYANGAILVAAGALLFFPRSQKIGGYALAGFLVLWVFVFSAPRLIVGVEAAWLAPAEILAVASGAWIASGEERLKRIVCVIFGLCLLTFGTAHFLYLEFTASMIPAFIPFHMFFAAFTGAGHIAAGLSIISGILARLGSVLLATMFSGFVLLLHIPRTFADPGNQIEWTMLCHAAALSGAAWLIAATLWKRKAL